ncbi:hypothetical protein RI129_009567 [Pyrocoelia pectoralis]|uniref:Uncharacterized protein n=1 Tax=Pyrocoelia pectoralis TaxID=417401 RepID=A0AAN7V2E8_9COLE
MGKAASRFCKNYNSLWWLWTVSLFFRARCPPPHILLLPAILDRYLFVFNYINKKILIYKKQNKLFTFQKKKKLNTSYTCPLLSTLSLLSSTPFIHSTPSPFTTKITFLSLFSSFSSSHSLIICHIVSLPSPHILHILFSSSHQYLLSFSSFPHLNLATILFSFNSIPLTIIGLVFHHYLHISLIISSLRYPLSPFLTWYIFPSSMESLSAFVDLQGFRGEDKKFIPKEFAVVTDDCKLVVLLIKPPTTYSVLSASAKKTVNYLEKRHHGIRWSSGYVPFQDFERETAKVLEPYRKIYVKGLEKCQVLRFLNKAVLNLEDAGCTSLTNLKNETQTYRCVYHNIEEPVCALENVLLLQDWERANSQDVVRGCENI